MIAPQLEALLRRPDPVARHILEAVVTESEAVKRTTPDWSNGTITGLTAVDGKLYLTPSDGNLITHTTQTTTWTDLDATDPMDVIRVQLSNAIPADATLGRVDIYLHPRRDGGQPQTVAFWKLLTYAVVWQDLYVGDPSQQNIYKYSLVPLNDPVIVAAGASAGAVTFTYPSTARLRLVNPSSRSAAFPLQGLIFRVIALKSDGQPANNVGLGYDGGVASVTTSGTTLDSVRLAGMSGQAPGPDLIQPFGCPYCTVKIGAYTTATATYDQVATKCDLGATPTENVEFVAVAQVPTGTSITAQVRNDADAAWVTFKDGDLTSDSTPPPKDSTQASGYQGNVALLAGVTKQQTYKVRVTLTTDAGGYQTPVMRELGVRSVTTKLLDGLTTVESADWSVDPVTLKPAVPQVEVSVIRDGVQDYYDAITDLLSTYDVGDLSFRLWVGHPTRLQRQYWLLVDVFTIDDYTATAAAARLSLIGVIGQLKQVLPQPVTLSTSGVNLTFDNILAGFSGRFPARITRASGSFIADGWQAGDVFTVTGSAHHDGSYPIQTVYSATVLHLPPQSFTGMADEGPSANITLGGTVRRAYSQTNVTLKDASDDLLDNQMAVPGHQRGPGIDDDTTQVGKVVTDSEAKRELDYLAAIAGGAFCSERGRICFRDFVTGMPIQAIFPSSEIRMRGAMPGLRQRAPETFLNYDYDASQEAFRAQAWGFNEAALLALGRAYIDAPKQLDDGLGQWIEDDDLAQTMVDRHVRALGNGLILWAFDSIYQYPELRCGDAIAVQTTQFVAKDPFANRALRGALWALGRITRVGKNGQSFEMWVRTLSDIIPSLSRLALPPNTTPFVDADFAPIASNPGTIKVTLTALPIGASARYLIQDLGAEVPRQSDAAWTVYSTSFAVNVASKAKQVSYFPILNGQYGRVITRPVDADTRPSATVFINQYDATHVQVGWTVDDDTRKVQLYLKQNALGATNRYPTLNPYGATDPLDQALFVGTIPVNGDEAALDNTGAPLTGMVPNTGLGGTLWQRSTAVAATDIIKVILVPLNYRGVAGDRATASFTVGAGATAALTAFSVALTTDGTNCASPATATVSWTPNAAVANGTHDLDIYRRTNGGDWTLVKTEASPATTTTYVDTLDEFKDAGSGYFTNYEYKYDLYETAGHVTLGTGQTSLMVETGGVCPV